MEIAEAEPPLCAELASPAPAPAVWTAPSELGSQGAVRLGSILEHETVCLDGGTLGCVAHVTGILDAHRQDATPIDISAAVDCSSSIRAAMSLIRQTMAFVVNELRSCDRLSVVCYHDEVTVRLPLRSMDAAGKAAARAAIEAMAAQGCTNLSGGITSAITQLRHNKTSDTQSRAAAVFLLTDGFPTRGIVNSAELLQSASTAHSCVGRTSCPIYAFGFGADHDSVMLSSLAERTDGAYCFIENAEGIAPAFAECLGSLQSVIAQDVKLLIQPESDTSVCGVLSSYPEESSSPKVFSFGDLRADEEKHLVIEIELPPWLVATGPPEPCLSLSLSFWDVAEGRSNVLKHVVRIKRENGVASSPCMEVEVQRQRVLVARAMFQAQQGSIVAGRAALTAAQLALEASPAVATNCDLIVQLRHDLQQCLNGFADVYAHSTSGRHALSTALSEHSRQRSVSGSLRRTSSYRTRSQTEAIRRASSTGVCGSDLQGENQDTGSSDVSSEIIASEVQLRIINRSSSRRVLPLQDTSSDETLIGGKYQLTQDQLGGGGTASVFRGLDMRSNRSVAIKRMHRAKIDCHRELLEQFRRELNISLRLDHPNVVRMLDVAFDSHYVYLVQELAEGGDLFDLVYSIGALPEARARVIFRQVASAVSYCHSMSVFHRDIKLENIVLVAQHSDYVKLTDFGLAKDCIESLEGPKTMRVGTVGFMAPEIAGGMSHPGRHGGYEGAPVDAWGLGCTLFVMTTGEFPFGEDERNMRQTLRRIREGAAGIDWETDHRGHKRALSHALVVILQGMLASHPTNRLDMKDIIASEWVQGDDGYAEISHQQPTQPDNAGGTLPTVEWPEETHVSETERLQHHDFRKPSLALNCGGIDDFDDLGLELEVDTDLCELRLNPIAEAPASSESSTSTTPNSGTDRRVRTVQFAASPRLNAAPDIDYAGPSAGSPSRFRCSPIDVGHDPTAASGFSPGEGASGPPASLIAQREAMERSGQLAKDRALAERLAEDEQTDQGTLLEEMQRKECLEAFAIPDGLECPITNELFEDPVMCTDGHTYERAAILSWFEEQRKSQAVLTSPMTNAALESDTVLPNFALKKQCEAFAASPAYVEHVLKNAHNTREPTGRAIEQHAAQRR